ncbi:hypothetical protein [Leptolyngbya sp. FACHB-261]|uniref:hypothetical protein n=1 Tax=Leptolyngbya sp. FACHB-261 TaxID=2692806 RepID=UPI0016828DA2|nr:hypothetical protein [Leptolyngbya sp. FACHB-261]MBD2102461.1 hypothetical protein [Leptolyngbya sp. FACHB-261]
MSQVLPLVYDHDFATGGLESAQAALASDDQLLASIDDLRRLLPDTQVGVRPALTVMHGSEKLVLDITPAESLTRTLSQR